MNRNMFKLIMVGETCVGKTCIIMRYTERTFTDSFLTTVGVDFKVKELVIDSTPIRIQIWDTAGQEQFHTITKSYFRGADGILLCFDLTSKQTLDKTRAWMESIRESASEKVNIVLVGNKCDLENREVTQEQGQEMADEFGINYYEASAKTGENITEIFETLAKDVMLRKERDPVVRTKTIDMAAVKPKKKECC